MLKTSHSGPSTLDRYEITKKINKIKEKYTKDNPHTRNLPNIYLVHGDLSDKDMCNLYNNPKVKAMVSLTRGEGFGRPLLEFSMVNKPIIASNWSGQLDFLNPEFVNLIPGVLVNIHPSASNKMLLQEAQWFEPNTQTFKKLLLDVYKNYKKHQEKAKRQGYYARNNFSYEKMKEKINTIFGNLNLVETIDFKE
jgi:glycosyltransferase involved in cell wall biosynthesis